MPTGRITWDRCGPSDRKVIEGLQGSHEPIDSTEIVHALRHHYSKRGRQVALIDGQREWTYEELGQRVFGICVKLDETFDLYGSRPRTFAVAIDRSADLVAAVHAIALTGNAYTPLDTTDPLSWRAFLIQKSGAAAVLVSDDAGSRVHLPDGVTRFDVHRAPRVTMPIDPAAIGANDPSQILFTSGSTGVPKGVISTHQGFANRIRWMQSAFPLSASDRVVLKTPCTFDVAGWEMFWPQYAGAQTVVVPPMHHTSPEALVSIFNVHRVTVAHFVPSMLRMWLQVEGARRCPELRMVLCSGEVLTPDLAAEFHRQSTAELHNLYGPTEASIDVTHFRVDRVLREPTPIGRPITNTNVYILDEDHAVCPVGEIGEIYIQGIGVASGYLEAEESEALQFSPVETSIGPSEWRTFRTGDAGRYTHDGQIEYCGRLDSQVKIRGQRVELAEVEKALRDQSAVLDVCAQAYEGGSGRTCIAAHVVLAANHCLSDPVGALMNYLMRSLPSRSVPTRIVIVSEIPLGSHGKIDRSKLVKPGRKRPDIGNLYRPPETTLETLIAGIWAQILDLDEVGITDDFHQIGGDSLAAVEISFLIAERLELDYDDELISDVLLDGDTVEKSARIAASRGIPDQFV